MQKRKLIELNNVFDGVKDLGDSKFKYNILRNIQILKPYLSVITDIEKEFQEILKDFEQDRVNLIKEIGKTKSDGSISIDLEDPSMVSLFKERFEELKEKHKTSLDLYDNKAEDFKKLLDEDIDEDINFRQISIDKCPIEGITSYQIEILIDFNIITE